MKTRIFLLVALIPLFVMSQKEVRMPDYPSYQQVMTQFLTDYDISSLKYPQEFRLTKNPDGWHALIWNYEKGDPDFNELYWSRNKKMYQQLSITKATTKEITPDEQNVIDDDMNILYDAMMPYTFYRGWYKDVIRDFGSLDNLSDTLLNALARAYAQQASNLLSDQYALSVKSEIFNLPAGQNALSDEQLASYRKWHDKSLETYLLLEKKNPWFTTFIGDIHTVYSNEVMTGVLTFMYFSNETEALKELRPGLYDDFMLKTARNYLLSCDSNAILFTHGDNDTYPLLYVQAFEHFRTDVTIINMSLLAINRYITHFYDDFKSHPAVAFSIDRSYWNTSANDFYYIDNLTDTMNAVMALKKTVEEDLKNPDKEFASYPSRYTVLKWNNTDSISIYPPDNFIYLNHIAMLDIISANCPKRPVYFTITSRVPFIPSEFLVIGGLTYKVVPFQTNEPSENYYIGKVDAPTVLDRFKNTFQIPDVVQHVFDYQQRFVYTYRLVMYQAFVDFAESGDKERALEILNLSEKMFSYGIFPAASGIIPVVEKLYNMGEKTRADQLSATAISGIGIEYPIDSKNQGEIESGYSMLNYLEKVISENSDDENLKKQIKEKTELYSKKVK